MQAPRTQPWALPGIGDVAGTMPWVLVAAPMPPSASLKCFAIALLSIATVVSSCQCLLCLPTALRGARKMPLDSQIFFS